MPVIDVWQHKGITRGAIPSAKLGRMAKWKSPLARGYIYFLEYDPQVLSYEEYPCTISYRWHGKTCEYIPDFLVYRQHHPPTLVACARKNQTHTPSFLAACNAASQWAQQRQYRFHLLTHEHLQKHAVLIHNLKQLAVHGHRAVEPHIVEYLLRTMIAAAEPLSLSEIIQQTPLVPSNIIPGVVWHLLARGQLCTDLTQPLHLTSTRIWWKGTQNPSPALHQATL